MISDYPSTDISSLPDLVRLAQQVRATRRPRVLRLQDEALAVLRPLPRSSRRQTPRPLTPAQVAARRLGGAVWDQPEQAIQLRLEL